MKKVMTGVLAVIVATSFVTTAFAATVSGVKFNDLNGNGVRDAGEPGLSGVTIFADINGNNVLDAGELSTTTDVNGNYSLLGLAAGTVAVREVGVAGWNQTTPGVSLGSEHTVNLATNLTSVADLNFGNQLAAAVSGSISGTKFNDVDADGVLDPGEVGLAGVTIFIDANGNNTLDSGEMSAVTNASGQFAFTGLSAGTFTVREQAQAGWSQTFPGASVDSEHLVTLTAGLGLTGVNFGNRLNAAATGSISGTKFNDLDADSIWDAGEAGLSGVTIYLDTNGNNQLDAGEMSALTNLNGQFSFTGLLPGTFTVREVLQTGWNQTFPVAGLSGEQTVTLGVGNLSLTGINFGNIAAQRFSGGISGTKFNDLDNDGRWDSGEPGLAGAVIYIDANNNDVRDAGEMTVLSDVNGNFSFMNLADGTYTLREDVMAGWNQTLPLAIENFEVSLTVDNGLPVLNVDFGNHNPSGVTVIPGPVGGPSEDPGAVLGDTLPVTGFGLSYMILPLIGLGAFLWGLKQTQLVPVVVRRKSRLSQKIMR